MAIPAGIIIMWDGSTSLPSGWVRETSLDGKFIKGTANGVDPNVTGGDTTHGHTPAAHAHPAAAHTHTGATATNNMNLGNQSTCCYWAPANHAHNYTTGSIGSTSSSETPALEDANSNPLHHTFIYIKSDGTPGGFPQHSSVLKANSTVPSGWIQHANSKGELAKGAAGSAAGGADGGATHTHASASHTHTSGNHAHSSSSVASYPQAQAGNSNSFPAQPGYYYHYIAHGHPLNITTSDGSTTSGAQTATSVAMPNDPAYRELRCLDKTSSGDEYLPGVIVMWLGTLSAAASLGWALCDGGDDLIGGTTPDMRDKFLMLANADGDIGGTGGAAGHAHASGGGHTHTGASHTHSTSVSTGASNWPNWTSGVKHGSGYPANPHSHALANMSSTTATLNTVDTTAANTADTQPPFRTVAFLSSPESALGIAPVFGVNF